MRVCVCVCAVCACVCVRACARISLVLSLYGPRMAELQSALVSRRSSPESSGVEVQLQGQGDPTDKSWRNSQ